MNVDNKAELFFLQQNVTMTTRRALYWTKYRKMKGHCTSSQLVFAIIIQEHFEETLTKDFPKILSAFP